MSLSTGFWRLPHCHRCIMTFWICLKPTGSWNNALRWMWREISRVHRGSACGGQVSMTLACRVTTGLWNGTPRGMGPIGNPTTSLECGRTEYLHTPVVFQTGWG